MLTWFLAYLLAGFVIEWIGTQFLKVPPALSWRLELAAIICWPVTIIVAIAAKRINE